MDKKRIIAHRGEVTLVEVTLSDGLVVYDVNIGHYTVAVVHAINDQEAGEIFRYLSAKSITVFTD